MPVKPKVIDVVSEKLLENGFNKSKKPPVFLAPKDKYLHKMQNLAEMQCFGRTSWPEIISLRAWMISAETSYFMKMGGLGMVASELPETYNHEFGAKGDEIVVVTPLYVGDTGKKKTSFNHQTFEYYGSEGHSAFLKKVTTIEVVFIPEGEKFVNYRVGVYTTEVNGVKYIFLENEHFFSINPHRENPSAQDGCYVYNENGVNEVERFAFFSKAVFVLLKDVFQNKQNPLQKPNLLIANDWHCGALAPLLKYEVLAQQQKGLLDDKTADGLLSLPVVHIVHHLGYQGWDYPNTRRLLNSLFAYDAKLVYRNAKAIKNFNPRVVSSLIVHDSYNQAAGHINLADRVVTVSRNYADELSGFVEFGWDFRDILRIRRDHRTFSGIVNGYEKSKIIPSASKIEHLNAFFKNTDFAVYDENSLHVKNKNKAEFIKLLGKLSTDEKYKQEVLPLLEFYKFDKLDIENPDKVPVFCATSRMAEQKGYDIAADAILILTQAYLKQKESGVLPIFVMGGAGSAEIFDYLKKLKDKVSVLNPEMGKRIFVFRGYKDEFAYAIQLAADFYMMPCRFEPCGLTQMEAFAKGALPMAMSTGGLVDTIINGVDGFRTEVFFVDKTRVYGGNLAGKRLTNNVKAFADMMVNALTLFYDNPDLISTMKKNAMAKDFSWNKGALDQYYRLFHQGV